MYYPYISEMVYKINCVDFVFNLHSQMIFSSCTFSDYMYIKVTAILILSYSLNC